KLKGAKVVGIAGSEEKITYLKEELHFDEVINYRTTNNMEVALQNACPEGVDVYYDNVGGEIADAVLTIINRKARIVVCGAISAYNLTEPDIGPRVQTTLIKKSALIQVFTVRDFQAYFQEAAIQLGKWLQAGKLQYRETIEE